MTSPAAVPALHRAMLTHLNEAFDCPEMLSRFLGPFSQRASKGRKNVGARVKSPRMLVDQWIQQQRGGIGGPGGGSNPNAPIPLVPGQGGGGQGNARGLPSLNQHHDRKREPLDRSVRYPIHCQRGPKRRQNRRQPRRSRGGTRGRVTLPWLIRHGATQVLNERC